MPEEDAGAKALQERLGQLREQFLHRSLQDAATILNHLPRVRVGDAAALTEIEFLAHRMYGMGATLGLDEITRHAGEIERVTEALLARAPASDESLVVRLERGAGELERRLQSQFSIQKASDF